MKMSESGTSLAIILYNTIRKHLGATEKTQSEDLKYLDKNTKLSARHIKERPDNPMSKELTRQEIVLIELEGCENFLRGREINKNGKNKVVGKGNIRVMREASTKAKVINNGLRSPSYLDNDDEQGKDEE
jgi:hypothetical protein